MANFTEGTLNLAFDSAAALKLRQLASGTLGLESAEVNPRVALAAPSPDNAGAMLRVKYGDLSPVQRQARIAELSEANYGRRVQDLEATYGTSNVHSIEKHGAQTTSGSQYLRVRGLNYPNPTTGVGGTPIKTASRFLSNKDHYDTLQAALDRQISGFQQNVLVEFDRAIGMNYRNLGTYTNRGPFSVNLTTRAVVRFDTTTQRFYTAYPQP